MNQPVSSRPNWLLGCFTIALATAAAACSASDADGELPPSSPSRSVTQGGPQDISEFRSVLGRSEVPSLELLDEVGFFAEHAIDLPPAECGDAVCVHPMLAVAPRFDGGNWSMAFVGLNTDVNPASFAPRPRHLIVVVEESSRTGSTLAPAPPWSTLAPLLEPEDRVSVVLASVRTDALAAGATPSELDSLPLPRSGSTAVDLYSALGQALELATREEYAELAQRVLFFTSGVSSRGVLSPENFTALGRRFAELGVGISTFGMGAEYRRQIPLELADVGSGNYYFVRSAADLANALRVEAETAFVPLARDALLRVEAQPGYRVGRIYGARRAAVDGNAAVLETPTLFIGARAGSSDVSSGRRGGGGGFFVELVADVPSGRSALEPADAFALRSSYVDASTGAPVDHFETLVTPLGVGQNPDPSAPYFSDAARAKPFMMLNMFLALRTSIALFEGGDCGQALGVRDMMEQSYEYWSDVYADPDIDADWTLLRQLHDVIDQRCDARQARPVDVPYGCFMF